MTTRVAFISLMLITWCLPSYAVDLDFARCTVELSEDPQVYEMKYDLARGYFNFNNSKYSAGVTRADSEVLVSITRKSDNVRINSYLIPNSEGKLSIAQSIGANFQRKEVLVQCSGIR